MDLIEQKIQSKEFSRHPWELARLQILFFFLRKTGVPKNFVLDVGSGDGYLASEIAEQFPKCLVIANDIHYGEKEKSGKKNNLLFLNDIGKLEGLTDQSANYVLLMDVLEHIEHPEILLRQITQLKQVDRSTQFIITVPAFQKLFTEHDHFLGHFKRYRRSELTQLMKAEGFKTDFSGYFFTSLFFVRLLQKLSGKKMKEGVHNWKGGQTKTKLLVSLLWIDFKISWYLSQLGIHLPGLSCYCLCHPLPS
jgi:2-polyprenyl-3-methyl-5-hydroxy-6-metoxy-1,4-benzoquinol methylase